MKDKDLLNLGDFLTELPPTHWHLKAKEKDLKKTVKRVARFDVYGSQLSDCYFPGKPISKLLDLKNE